VGIFFSYRSDVSSVILVSRRCRNLSQKTGLNLACAKSIAASWIFLERVIIHPILTPHIE
jgi:hypothetical protein